MTAAIAFTHEPQAAPQRFGIPFDRSHHHGPGSDDTTPRPGVVLDDAQEELLRAICRGRSGTRQRLPLRDTERAEELAELGMVRLTRNGWLATTAGRLAVEEPRAPRLRMPSRGRHDLGTVNRKAVRRCRQ